MYAPEAPYDHRGPVPQPEGADPRRVALPTVNPATASRVRSEFVDLRPGDRVIRTMADSGAGGHRVPLAKPRGRRPVNGVPRA